MKNQKAFYLTGLCILVIILCSAYYLRNSTDKQPVISYEARKENAQALQHELAHRLEAMSSSEAGPFLKRQTDVFNRVLLDSIIACWYDTPWDFNGTATRPGKDAIACGYFVTTTLLHAGVKLNRAALAQCASEQMIKELVDKENIHRYSNKTIQEYMASIRRLGEGIYITGLDNHTGFTYYDGEDVWFIHSSGTEPYCVVKQKAGEADLLVNSKYRVAGKISTATFMRKWLNLSEE